MFNRKCSITFVLSLLLGALMLSCGACSYPTGRTLTGLNTNPSDAKEAFEVVTQVLQAPYLRNGTFFKIPDEDIEKTLYGESGYWAYSAKMKNGDTDGTITYKYDNYKPYGSPITINGEINLTESKSTEKEAQNSKNSGSDNTNKKIGFKKGQSSELKITGSFDAKLKFSVGLSSDLDVTPNDYDKKLIHCETKPCDLLKVEFEYHKNGSTDQNEKLEICCKGVSCTDNKCEKSNELIKKILRVEL